MNRTTACVVLRFGLLLGCCAFGCATVDPPAPANAKPDPFLDEILNSPPVEKKPGSATLKPDAVLKEVPLQTSVAQARAIMERNGFDCWSGVAEGDTVHLRCTAYKKRPDQRFDRIVVKLYYENKQIVNANVAVMYGVKHSEHGFWPSF